MRSPGWVVLTTIGRRTGLPRQTRLPCGRRDGELVVVSTYRWRSDWKINFAVLKLREDGTYQQLYNKWFGSSDE
jgi:hypothetical protein